MSYQDLVRIFGDAMFIGAEKFRFLYDKAEETRGVPGDVAEIGVYKGGVIAALAAMFPEKTAHAFDTFSGMPTTHFADIEHHGPGDFSDTSLEAVAAVMRTDNYKLHAGRFPETAVEGTFSFVHADGDYYETTRDVIDWFWPRLSPGGIIVFDDWREQACPGVERALREGVTRYGFTIGFRYGGRDNDQAYIKK